MMATTVTMNIADHDADRGSMVSGYTNRKDVPRVPIRNLLKFLTSIVGNQGLHSSVDQTSIQVEGNPLTIIPSQCSSKRLEMISSNVFAVKIHVFLKSGLTTYCI